MTGPMGKGRAVDIAYLKFSKAFDAVSCNILRAKLMIYELHGRTIRKVENSLAHQTQKMLMSGTKPSCQPVTSGVPQGPKLRPIRFNVCYNKLDDGTECTHSIFVDDTKVGRGRSQYTEVKISCLGGSEETGKMG